MDIIQYLSFDTIDVLFADIWSFFVDNKMGAFNIVLKLTMWNLLAGFLFIGTVCMYFGVMYGISVNDDYTYHWLTKVAAEIQGLAPVE